MIIMRALRVVTATAAVVGLLAACSESDSDRAGTGAQQTRFPGQVSAGGGTSGEVMARSAPPADTAAMPSGTPGIPQGSGGTTSGAAMGGTHGPSTGANAGQEGMRGQAPPGGSVSGTPSIPEGAGGTPSGAAMGGTTGGAAASQTTPPPGGAAPTVPAQEGKK